MDRIAFKEIAEGGVDAAGGAAKIAVDAATREGMPKSAVEAAQAVAIGTVAAMSVKPMLKS